jgi:hypothetical protein
LGSGIVMFPISLAAPLSLMVSLSNHARSACSLYSCKYPHSPSSSVLGFNPRTEDDGGRTETYPTLPIIPYFTHVLSGGNASGNFRKSGKDRRFGLAGRTCETGEVSLKLLHSSGQQPDEGAERSGNLKSSGRVVLGSQASHTGLPKTRVPRTARHSLFQWPDAKAGVATGKV